MASEEGLGGSREGERRGRAVAEFRQGAMGPKAWLAAWPLVSRALDRKIRLLLSEYGVASSRLVFFRGLRKGVFYVVNLRNPIGLDL